MVNINGQLLSSVQPVKLFMDFHYLRGEMKQSLYPDQRWERDPSTVSVQTDIPSPVLRRPRKSETGDGNKTPFWHLAGAIGPNIYICTFPVWEVLKETCVKELMWSIDQLLSFPALTREPITGTLYWEARQRRIERKINMETFCEQREKMLNKILDVLCCQILQHLWVNNSVFKTVIRRWWWHCIRFLSY